MPKNKLNEVSNMFEAKEVRCIYCGKETGLAVHLNKGIYCMKCWEIGKALQDSDLLNKKFKDMSKLDEKRQRRTARFI